MVEERHYGLARRPRGRREEGAGIVPQAADACAHRSRPAGCHNVPPSCRAPTGARRARVRPLPTAPPCNENPTSWTTCARNCATASAGWSAASSWPMPWRPGSAWWCSPCWRSGPSRCSSASITGGRLGRAAVDARDHRGGGLGHAALGAGRGRLGHPAGDRGAGARPHGAPAGPFRLPCGCRRRRSCWPARGSWRACRSVAKGRRCRWRRA